LWVQITSKAALPPLILGYTAAARTTPININTALAT
jgi:hypothetical protein